MPHVQKAVGDFILAGRKIAAVKVDQTVADAVAVMKATSAEGVAVLDDGAVAGVFTGRDYLNRVAGPGRVPSQTPVAEVMTADPEVLQRGHSIAWAINKMVLGSYRNIPILDGDEPVWVLSVHDVIGHLFGLFADVVAAPDEPEVDDWTDLGGG